MTSQWKMWILPAPRTAHLSTVMSSMIGFAILGVVHIKKLNVWEHHPDFRSKFVNIVCQIPKYGVEEYSCAHKVITFPDLYSLNGKKGFYQIVKLQAHFAHGYFE